MMRRFLTGQALIAAVWAGGVTVFHWGAWGAWRYDVMSVGVAGAVSILAYVINMQGLHASPYVFVRSVLGAMTARFIFSLGYVLLVAFNAPVRPVAFAVVFALAFFSFLSFEVYTLMDNLRAKK